MKRAGPQTFQRRKDRTFVNLFHESRKTWYQNLISKLDKATIRKSISQANSLMLMDIKMISRRMNLVIYENNFIS